MAKSKKKLVVVSEDIFEDGKWLQRKNDPSGKYKWTISGSRWNNLKDRTRAGPLWDRIPSYIGSKNEFINFQHFVEWSRKQIGYDKHNYNLDSDILRDGDKIYSENTCLFIPQQLNRFIQGRNAGESGYYGICLAKTRDKLLVRCEIDTGFISKTLTSKYFNISDIELAKEHSLKYKNIAKNIWLETLESGLYEVDLRVIEYMKNWKFSYD